VPDSRFSDPPTITLHGIKDVLVPFRLAEQLTAALKNADVRAELVRKPAGAFEISPLICTYCRS
jgi:dipeptidyl aminopeptidase/acylaminoacyl peptidase